MILRCHEFVLKISISLDHKNKPIKIIKNATWKSKKWRMKKWKRRIKIINSNNRRKILICTDTENTRNIWKVQKAIWNAVRMTWMWSKMRYISEVLQDDIYKALTVAGHNSIVICTQKNKFKNKKIINVKLW